MHIQNFIIAWHFIILYIIKNPVILQTQPLCSMLSNTTHFKKFCSRVCSRYSLQSEMIFWPEKTFSIVECCHLFTILATAGIFLIWTISPVDPHTQPTNPTLSTSPRLHLDVTLSQNLKTRTRELQHTTCLSSLTLHPPTNPFLGTTATSPKPTNPSLLPPSPSLRQTETRASAT